ncbi:MAG: transposase [Gemmataceae bacterium]|nr:transposase [Gemmataceae bacterium]
MPQSLARNLIHFVTSTKNREPYITPELREGLFAYLAGILNALRCPAVAVGGVADHVHILFLLAKTARLCDVVEELKKDSSKWAKENGGPPHFYWQAGYGAFSVSPRDQARVARYIARQEEHHAATTFQDELRGMLTRAGIEFDERYVWD